MTDFRELARKWRNDHPSRVAMLIAEDGPAYAPSGSDAMRPELWRSPHWRWLAREDGEISGNRHNSLWARLRKFWFNQ